MYLFLLYIPCSCICSSALWVKLCVPSCWAASWCCSTRPDSEPKPVEQLPAPPAVKPLPPLMSSSLWGPPCDCWSPSGQTEGEDTINKVRLHYLSAFTIISLHRFIMRYTHSPCLHFSIKKLFKLWQESKYCVPIFLNSRTKEHIPLCQITLLTYWRHLWEDFHSM